MMICLYYFKFLLFVLSLVCQFRVYILNTHICIGTQYTYLNWLCANSDMCIEDVPIQICVLCANSDMCIEDVVYGGCTGCV